jgi:hypothetical protein
MEPAKLNLLAIAAAAVSSFLLGGLWYSPVFLGRRWAALTGLTEERLQAGVARVFGGAFVCQLIAAVNLAFFIGSEASFGFAVFAGLAAGLGWVATGLTTTFLFERRPLALIAIDASYHVVALTLMAAILGAWR